MKNIYSLLLAFVITTLSLAQAPHTMSYQAVVRDAEGNLVIEQEVGMKISILKGTADGMEVYTETMTPTTNKNGLVSIEIGGEAGFADIDWSSGPYFLKTETDPEGGTDYTISGTNQLLNVPYALHAKTAETISEPIVESDPVFAAWDKSEGIEITESQITDLQTYYLATNPDGFITTYIVTEEDVTAHETAVSISESQITDLQSYLTSITGQSIGDLTDVDLTNIESGKVLKYDAVEDKWIIGDDLGITEETDPVFEASPAAGIEVADIGNWDEAHSWGDHSEAEYITQETQNLSDVLGQGNDGNAIQIKNISDPTDVQDAATKAYVDLLEEKVNALLSYYESYENPPLITTSEIIEITDASATCGGNILNNGGTDITARGIVWHTEELPTLDNNSGFTTDGLGLGEFVSELTELTAETTYYVRTYATNTAGTGYGSQLQFTTLADVPTTHTLNLIVSPEGSGTVTGAGEYAEGAEVPVTATASTGYTFVNWTNGADVVSTTASFTYTMPAEDVTLTANFELEPVELYTLTLTASPEGSGTVTGAGNYAEGAEVPVTATASTGYTFVNWTNGADVVSTTASFTYTMPAEDVTLTANFEASEGGGGDGTVTDQDGNVYATVIIGTQEWMAENLRVTKYNNGDAIPTGLDNTEWRDTKDGAYSIFPHDYYGLDNLNSDAEVLEAYGALYNGYAVFDARGLCPNGWHVPTDAEWDVLVDYVVAQGYPNSNVDNGAGNALKSCRQLNHPDGGDCDTSEAPRWTTSSTNSGFDEFGFSALPGGYRHNDGSGHWAIGEWGQWWSSTETVEGGNIVWDRSLFGGYGHLGDSRVDKARGKSVRCIRD